MKKKSIIIIGIVVLMVILLFPIPRRLNDGGTVEYRALLYTITDYHKLALETGESKTGYVEGIKIEILGIEIFNSLEEKETFTEEEKKENLTDVEIDTKGYSSFVGTVLEETTKYMLVEPNEDEAERKIADKIKINYGSDNIDFLYGIGKKVVIYYSGYIMESYPAQINTDKIYVDGYEDFEITVKKSTDISKKKILNNKNLASDGRDFNLYYYGLDEVNVKVDNKEMPLEKALESGKITLNGIVKKANIDIKDVTIYKDGGSSEYHYKDYTIIKLHKENGNRDLYIGIPEMTINDLKL